MLLSIRIDNSRATCYCYRCCSWLWPHRSGWWRTLLRNCSSALSSRPG